ncbi:Trimethylamine methyltransferase [Desulfamplus magnetovallimortis]|uniref:Trimethylamine methyltransferase n=1 Tax=Desulfamplus magnetovallimortis TaxID=1246637 RepID=A0A1W1HCU5_9BACT|nr:trimethylamine methyltransferase family protein [Desulfamplus magnetovallimortis]SLM30256.1 Trimethylamine methyltransferase [Desulfamplus magnetovallimortis]
MISKLLKKEIIESIYESATDILSTTGIEFDMESARELFKKNGAGIDGKKVYISPFLLEKSLGLMPQYIHESTDNKKVVAGSPFSNSPMVLDDRTGDVRNGTVEDAVKMYQLAETSELYESVNPGIVDPEGNDSEDKFIAQIAMLLKYSDKFPSLGLRATPSNTKNGNVYASARKAIELIKEIKEEDKKAVMGQGICPMAPLSYDEESLINLTVLAEENQDITISPCTLSFMTGPESLMGIVIHDVAICLAGAVYLQLLKPETSVAFTNFSTMTDMRTMQPVYASPEYLHVQIMFYEVCQYFGMNSVLCGCLADAARNDYQAGFESCLTTIAPFFMTDVDRLWCYPGHMAAFSGGSFDKMIFDEELLINCNRVLQGMNLSIDPLLKEKLEKAHETKSFLTIGDVNIYRKEQRISKIFDKRGLNSNSSSLESPIHLNARKEIDRRCAEYILPERSKRQKALLQKYLPSQCKY